jgi:hypothetical protein
MPRISQVPITDCDLELLEEMRVRLAHVKEATLAALLLHHGIWNAGAILGGEIQAVLDDAKARGLTPASGVSPARRKKPAKP